MRDIQRGDRVRFGPRYGTVTWVSVQTYSVPNMFNLYKVERMKFLMGFDIKFDDKPPGDKPEFVEYMLGIDLVRL